MLCTHRAVNTNTHKHTHCEHTPRAVGSHSDPYSEFVFCTHTAMNTHTHTHTVNTHPEQWAAIYATAPGEQLGVRCLAQGSHLSRGIEDGESAGHSLPPSTIPAGPETRTCDLWVTISTLFIRPRLPIYICICWCEFLTHGSTLSL